MAVKYTINHDDYTATKITVTADSTGELPDFLPAGSWLRLDGQRWHIKSAEYVADTDSPGRPDSHEYMVSSTAASDIPLFSRRGPRIND